MEAQQGDRLLMHGRTVGQHDRVAEIVEVMGDARRAALPRAVRGRARGHDVAGPDSVVRHTGARHAGPERGAGTWHASRPR